MVWWWDLFLPVSFLGRFYGIVFCLLRWLCLVVGGFDFGLNVCFLGLTIVLVFGLCRFALLFDCVFGLCLRVFSVFVGGLVLVFVLLRDL